MSISFEAQLGASVRHAAGKAGKPLSNWLAEAAAAKLRAEKLAEFLDGWEAEHGGTDRRGARPGQEVPKAACRVTF